jgi:predicted HTH domain antitoxin
MTLSLELPPEVIEALGVDPQREALEALLLRLVQQGKLTLARAGEQLGMNRWQALEWYTSQGFPYPNYTVEDLEHDIQHARSRLARS